MFTGKRIDLIQNTQIWLDWRQSGLGSSDAAVIMGVSPWKTADTLLYEKSTRRSTKNVTSAMRRGSRLEPFARDVYQKKTYLHLPPVCMQHQLHPYIIGSFDGANEEHSIILEIKAPNDKTHAEARQQRIPEIYFPQCQHLLMVSGAQWLHYVSFNGMEIVPVLVRSDLEYQEKLLAKEVEFWKKVMGCRDMLLKENKDAKAM